MNKYKLCFSNSNFDFIIELADEYKKVKRTFLGEYISIGAFSRFKGYKPKKCINVFEID